MNAFNSILFLYFYIPLKINLLANPVLNNDTISCSSLYIDYNVANIEIRNLLLNEQGNHNQKDKEEDDGKKELSNVEEQSIFIISFKIKISF